MVSTYTQKQQVKEVTMALVYKDGITRTIEDKELNKFLELGFEIVEPEQEKIEPIEEKPKKAKKGE